MYIYIHRQAQERKANGKMWKALHKTPVCWTTIIAHTKRSPTHIISQSRYPQLHPKQVPEGQNTMDKRERNR